MGQVQTHHASGYRGRRLRAALSVGAMAVLTALALALGAPGSRPAGVAGQAEPTSTPIRLIRLEPETDPTPAPTAAPTSDAVVIVIEEEDAEPTSEAEDAVSLEFEADDWAGGYYQGNGVWYGRAWTAVYGAQSQYPAATLTFDLEEAPTQDLVFVVTGLDDELAGKNPIALEINGERVYEGDSPFASWNGDTTNQARDARWTTVEVTLPADLFTDGENTIAFLNLSPSDAFGLPPYNLLSTASLTTDDDEDDDAGEAGLPLDDGDEDGDEDEDEDD